MNDSRLSVVQKLAIGIRQLEKSGRRFDRDLQPVVSTGISSLDLLLPHQGLLRGTLTEWVSTSVGGGAMTLAMMAARKGREARPVIIVDPQHQFYPPAAKLLNLPLPSLTIIRPHNRRDTLWALEQALRCRAVGAVLATLDYMTSHEFRRLQLAAQVGNSLCLLVRTGIDPHQATWADVRLQVKPVSTIGPTHIRRLHIHILHARGCCHDAGVVLDVCDESGAVCLVSQLSSAAVSSRAAGA
jgi:protein ImuA